MKTIFIFCVIFFFSSSLFAYNTKNIILCIGQSTEEAETLCEDFKRTDFFPIKKAISFSSNKANYIQAIAEIQQAIRNAIELYQSPHRELSHILIYAKGLTATMTAIAQTNLLPYYRTHISGLVLDNPVADLVKECDFYAKKPQNNLCNSLRTFTKNLEGRAALIEVATALSPTLQTDWFWPKTLLLYSDENLSHKYRKKWLDTFENQSIQYSYVKYDESNHTKMSNFQSKQEKIHLFTQEVLTTVTKKLLEPKPDYYGPVLRFHLYKIAYTPKQKLKIKQNISYGKDPQQKYDLFVKEHTKKNPLFIYIHGGGWSKGDKISFEDISKQYADKGFTAVSINYRLLNLPTVSMKEIVDDVRGAIRHIFTHEKSYQAESNNTIIIAESAGAQLAFMAISTLNQNEQKKIKATVLNSMTSDLTLHPKAKQIRLFGIKDDNERLQVIQKYSPLNHLKQFPIPTLSVHSIKDKVVPPKHLEDISVKAVLYHDNIKALWTTNGSHPVVPSYNSLQPGYQHIEQIIKNFENKQLNTKKYKLY